MMLIKGKFVNWVITIWHHGDQPLKSQLPSTPDAGVISTASHRCFCPRHPISSFFSVADGPSGGPVEGGMWLPLGVSEHPAKDSRILQSLNHPTWNGIVHIWKRAPLGSNPPPSTQVMQLSSEHTLPWTREGSFQKTHLSSSCLFPLRPRHRIKGG